MTRFALLSALLAALACPVLAQQSDGPAIHAKGLGMPPEQHRGKPIGTAMAERAAITDAVRNLAVAVGAYFEVQDGDEKTRVVEAFIAGFSIVSKTERPDGGVEVEVALPIERVAGNFRNALAEAAKVRAELENPPRQPAPPRARGAAGPGRMEEMVKRFREGR